MRGSGKDKTLEKKKDVQEKEEKHQRGKREDTCSRWEGGKSRRYPLIGELLSISLTQKREATAGSSSRRTSRRESLSRGRMKKVWGL